MLTIVSEPGSEVTSSADPLLRLQLRLEDGETEENALIDEMAAAARDFVEGYTQRFMITRTVRMEVDFFPATALRLPTGPVKSVTGVFADDGTGVLATLDVGDFRLALDGPFWQLTSSPGASWPVGRRGAVEFKVGYGEAPEDVPSALRQAIRIHVATQFRDREANVIGASATELPAGLMDMLRPWRLYL